MSFSSSVREYYWLNIYTRFTLKLNMRFKRFLKMFLQNILGFKRYLFLFSLVNIHRLKYDAEFLFFNDLIKDGGIVLDIGANIGTMTAHLAKKHKSSKIYAFEPIPENIETLQRIVNHYKLDNVKIYQAALGNISGELKMLMPVINNVKMHGLSHVVKLDIGDKTKEGNVYAVPVYKLDEIEELKGNDEITAIKLDVENFEYQVLKGGEQLLIKHKPIIYCELWDNEERNLTINYLKDLGYKVKVYHHKQLIDYSNQQSVNFFFIPIDGYANFGSSSFSGTNGI